MITEGLAGKADHFSEEEQLIVKRLIHTTGDFDYVNIVEFHNNPIESAKEALEAGNCKIYCDTNMIVNGLNKNGLKKFGAEAYCLVADPDVAREAKERGITRSMVGLERALKDPQTKIFVIGNAPTALFTLLEKMEKEGTAEKVVSKVKEVAEDAKDAVEGAIEGVKNMLHKDEK